MRGSLSTNFLFNNQWSFCYPVKCVIWIASNDGQWGIDYSRGPFQDPLEVDKLPNICGVENLARCKHSEQFNHEKYGMESCFSQGLTLWNRINWSQVHRGNSSPNQPRINWALHIVSHRHFCTQKLLSKRYTHHQHPCSFYTTKKQPWLVVRMQGLWAESGGFKSQKSRWWSQLGHLTSALLAREQAPKNPAQGWVEYKRGNMY